MKKKEYTTPETTVVAVAPVKLLEGTGVHVDPGTQTDVPPLKLNHTTIPSNTGY